MGINFDFVVEDRHFDYLSIQKGDISNYMTHRPTWETAYSESLRKTYESFKDYLPRKCNNILDIGSGLGGIDILINRHYNENCKITLLDGHNDDPVVVKHAQTFNNMQVAKDFHEKNGTKYFQSYTPQYGQNYVRPRLGGVFSFDVIVSFASYCFHYSPELYLDFILKASTNKTIFIFDIRKDKPEWLNLLKNHLSIIAEVVDSRKYSRVILAKTIQK